MNGELIRGVVRTSLLMSVSKVGASREFQE